MLPTTSAESPEASVGDQSDGLYGEMLSNGLQRWKLALNLTATHTARTLPRSRRITPRFMPAFIKQGQRFSHRVESAPRGALGRPVKDGAP